MGESFCPNCSYPNNDKSKYCTRCGSPLAATVCNSDTLTKPLILAILSIALSDMPIIAFIFAVVARKAVRNYDGPYVGKAKTIRILGLIGIILSGVLTTLFIILLLLGGALAALFG